jgi:hypothetical protein
MTRSGNLALAAAVAAASLLGPRAARGDERTREDFAEALMRDGDYFRAVSVYKELAFFAAAPRDRARYAYRIGTAYRLAHRYELAVDALSALLATPDAAPDLLGGAYAQIGASYVGLKVPWQSDEWLAQADAHGAPALASFFRGAARAEERRWGEARQAFAAAAAAAPGTKLAGAAQAAAQRLGHAEAIGHRSPALAVVLSAVVPGAGQAYAGHWWDALQAAAFVGAFAFTSYVAYRYDDSRGGPYWLTGISLSITGLLHLSNILGAERTARYYNARQEQLLLDPIRATTLDLDL